MPHFVHASQHESPQFVHARESVSVPRHAFWLVRVRVWIPNTEHERQPVHAPQVSQQAPAGHASHAALSLCGCVVPLQPFCDARVRERVLVPLVVHVPWQAPQSP